MRQFLSEVVEDLFACLVSKHKFTAIYKTIMEKTNKTFCFAITKETKILKQTFMTKITRSMMSCGIQHGIQNSHGLFTFSIGIWGTKTILLVELEIMTLLHITIKIFFLLNESQHHVLKIK